MRLGVKLVGGGREAWTDLIQQIVRPRACLFWAAHMVCGSRQQEGARSNCSLAEMHVSYLGLRFGVPPLIANAHSKLERYATAREDATFLHVP